MSLWFKSVVFKLKKGIPAIIMECPFVFYNRLEREKQDFIELRFWMYRVNRLTDNLRRSHGLGYSVKMVGEATPHTCRRS
jgi:hypothetical protein